MVTQSKNSHLIISIVAAVLVTLSICLGCAMCSGGVIHYEATFCFVCYKTPENSVSASSLSENASSLGGAGYTLRYNGNYYATIACYYNQHDAQTVCRDLKSRGIECSVLDITTGDYRIKRRKDSKLYLGNLDTVYSLSNLAYDCANNLDTGKFSQNKAKELLNGIKSGLNGLCNSNKHNAFTEPLKSVAEECKKLTGFLAAKDMRYIQIALADIIINAKL